MCTDQFVEAGILLTAKENFPDFNRTIDSFPDESTTTKEMDPEEEEPQDA